MLTLLTGIENNTVDCTFQVLEALFSCFSENIRSGIAAGTRAAQFKGLHHHLSEFFYFFGREQIGELKGDVLATTTPTSFQSLKFRIVS